MIDYGTVQSAERPEKVRIDDYSVWISTNVSETEDGFIFHMVRYTKDEYIKLMDEVNQKAQADLEYIAMMTEVELD